MCNLLKSLIGKTRKTKFSVEYSIPQFNLYSYQGWCHMRAKVLKIDFLLSFSKYDKRKSLSVLVYSIKGRHNILKSSKIFPSNKCHGPSTRSLQSRSLEIEAQCTVRSQSNWREREGSLVTKVVDSEWLLIKSRSFHPGQILFEKVSFLHLRHSKVGRLHKWQSRASLVLSETKFFSFLGLSLCLYYLLWNCTLP